MKFLAILPFLALSTLSTAWRLDIGKKHLTSFNGDHDRRCTAIDSRAHHTFTWDGDEGTRRTSKDDDCCVTLYEDKECHGKKRNAEEFCGGRKYTGRTTDPFSSFSVDCAERKRDGRP
jgi:hypothetical protein